MTTIEPLARPFAFFTVAALVGSILTKSAGAEKAAKLFSSLALGMSVAGLIGAVALTATGGCLFVGGMLSNGNQQMVNQGAKKQGGAFALGSASVLTLAILGLRSLAN